MNVCTYLHIYVTYVRTHASTRTLTHTHAHSHTHTHTHTHTHSHIYIRTHARTHTHTHTATHIHARTHTINVACSKARQIIPKSNDLIFRFLNQVTIRDVQTNTVWHFVCDKWLADTENIAQTLYANEPAGFSYSFILVFMQKMFDTQMFFSLFSRSMNTAFTPVERVSCGVTATVLAMLSNLALLKLYDPFSYSALDNYAVSYQNEITIGVLSAAITFPMCFLLETTFRRAARIYHGKGTGDKCLVLTPTKPTDKDDVKGGDAADDTVERQARGHSICAKRLESDTEKNSQSAMEMAASQTPTKGEHTELPSSFQASLVGLQTETSTSSTSSSSSSSSWSSWSSSSSSSWATTTSSDTLRQSLQSTTSSVETLRASPNELKRKETAETVTMQPTPAPTPVFETITAATPAAETLTDYNASLQTTMPVGALEEESYLTRR